MSKEKEVLTDDQKCSMLYWYPKIKDVVPTPKTVFVPLPENVEAWMDEGIPKELVEKLRKANKFGYPVFMRTDQLAGKHSWIETCYVSESEEIGRNCYRLIEENLMADFMGGMNPKAMVLREFLNLDAPFEAFKGMPIAREFRIFADNGEVVCMHPYWPKTSIEFWSGTKPSSNWETKLAEQSRLPAGKELEHLKDLAKIASKKVGGYWSIDLCKTKSGKWYLTDMAVGEKSFHWEGCPKSRTKLM